MITFDDLLSFSPNYVNFYLYNYNCYYYLYLFLPKHSSFDGHAIIYFVI